MNRSRRAIVAFGANQGDPLGNILKALGRLKDFYSQIAVSSVFRTKAVGGPIGQPDFLNGVVIYSVNDSPIQTMNKLLAIETELGRVRREKWGPRTIDLDLIDYEGVVLNESDLVLPHPRIAERSFVLLPLAEIAPSWTHPITGLSPREMIDRLSDDDKAVILRREELP